MIPYSNKYNLPYKIQSIALLAKILGVSVNELKKLSDDLDSNPNKRVRRVTKKTKGKIRECLDLREPYKSLNRKVNVLLSKVPLPENYYGGVKGRRTKDHGTRHKGPRYVLMIDIKDYFSSISSNAVKKLLVSIGCSPPVAKILVKLTTFDGFLPQGFPTSTTIANIYSAKYIFDIFVTNHPRKYLFTVWVDDFTLSREHPIDSKDIDDLIRIIKGCRLKIHPTKFKRFGPRQKKLITGIEVGETIHAPYEKISNIESELHHLRHASTLEVSTYKIGLNMPEKHEPFKDNSEWFLNHLKGKLANIAAIDPQAIRRIKRRYSDVTEKYDLLS